MTCILAYLRFLTIAKRLNRISPAEYLAMRSSIAGDATLSQSSPWIPEQEALARFPLSSGMSPRFTGPDFRPSSSKTYRKRSPGARQLAGNMRTALGCPRIKAASARLGFHVLLFLLQCRNVRPTETCRYSKHRLPPLNPAMSVTTLPSSPLGEDS